MKIYLPEKSSTGKLAEDLVSTLEDMFPGEITCRVVVEISTENKTLIPILKLFDEKAREELVKTGGEVKKHAGGRPKAKKEPNGQGGSIPSGTLTVRVSG